jgi:hypothetical protein
MLVIWQKSMLEYVLIIKCLKWFLNACKHMSNLTKEPNKDAIPVQYKDQLHSRTGHEGLKEE